MKETQPGSETRAKETHLDPITIVSDRNTVCSHDYNENAKEGQVKEKQFGPKTRDSSAPNQ